MTSVIRFLVLAGLVIGSLSITALTQSSTVILDTEAAQHVGQHITVEGVVAKVFTNKRDNTFLNFGAAYPAQTFTGWIPADTSVASDPSVAAVAVKKSVYRSNGEVRYFASGDPGSAATRK